MTNDERLATLESIVDGLPGYCVGDVYWMKRDGVYDIRQTAYPHQLILQHEDLVEAIYQARQKLAAEREAKKSPRERRLEVILRKMVETVEGAHLHYMLAGVSVNDAKEALKED